LRKRWRRGRLINFTNPSGLVTEALLKHGAVPAVGLCNSPVGFVRGIAEELRVEPERVVLDYVGLNHLSWIRGVRVDEEDVFEGILAGAIERARAGDSPFGAEVLETLRMLPNYYLRYYYHHDRVVAEQRAAGKTRGEEVREIEANLLKLYEDPALAEKPKMLEKRGGAHYSTAAVALIRAMAQDTGEVQIVNTANEGALAGLAAEAVVEMPAAIGREGARAIPTRPMGPESRGLVQAVKAYEELTVEAAVTGDARAAVKALMAHPLVPSFDVARELWAAILEANRAYLPRFEGRR
jgi:6-phospho-beta-glucosidase